MAPHAKNRAMQPMSIRQTYSTTTRDAYPATALETTLVMPMLNM